MLFPLVIGFTKLTRKELPAYMYPKIGRPVFLLGQLILIGGLVAYFEPVIGFITLAVGVIIRIIIAIYFAQQEKQIIMQLRQVRRVLLLRLFFLIHLLRRWAYLQENVSAK